MYGPTVRCKGEFGDGQVVLRQCIRPRRGQRGSDILHVSDHAPADLGIRQAAPGRTHVLAHVVDLYDVADDWIPIYDKSDLAGFYMAVGSSGNQFKNAPVAGAMMAELIAACAAGCDHDADPIEFAMRHTGRALDFGFFSRRREINKESSMSVLG